MWNNCIFLSWKPYLNYTTYYVIFYIYVVLYLVLRLGLVTNLWLLLNTFPKYFIDKIKTPGLHSISHHNKHYLIGLYSYEWYGFVMHILAIFDFGSVADPWSPAAAWVAVMTTMGADGDLGVVADFSDIVKILLNQLHCASFVYHFTLSIYILMIVLISIAMTIPNVCNNINQCVV